ncbi:metal ABC transporter substrate-binding protein [Streptomyces sp. NPDC090052]|uniref:metal ABC transporter substrate-binding protein n=1 Tax=unclassified Streptomyces TaxID=2593676 RepID=UPI0022576514|nr:metal ABC transporter substrate-binding protein [Streptomyces sp. NBC_01306]MCX4726682.1 metal ABC transporter substrate-binding protein [Streptomyces sp. NBC_01306]WSV04014.1 metal ABC transporter substrate-binding protein [Streptomyces sp. NBC_01020]WSX69875.1 metal ABC transporter substrate-binding protein [Streptomyces sp. NBC_00932]
MNIRRLVPVTAVSAAVAAGLVGLSACSGSSAAADHKDGKLHVVASFYPLQYLTQEIGGDHVSVTNLTKPGVEPHDLELSPKQTVALSSVDAIVYLKGLQPAVDEAIKQSGVKYTADAASMTTLEKHGTEVDGHHHTTGDNDSHSESEAGLDPHIWLDPVRFAQVAKGVDKTLAAADPKHKADYRKNTDALVRKLDALNKQYVNGLKNRTSDTFVTTHAAFGYLAERYGLTEEAISGIDPESEPSVSRMKDLHALAAKHHVNTVFFETIANPDTARTLAGDLHVKTGVLDPLEGITDKSKGRDYLQVMQSNLVALQKALGAE